MPDSAANSSSAWSTLETSEIDGGQQKSAPPSLHHGSGIADSTLAGTLPPTVTPATTTRQQIPLGVLSTLWANSSNPSIDAQSNPLPDPSVPAIVTHAPSPDTQEPRSDLATSSGSVPSTTTTLTNTLPPTQSAALRALNAPAFQSQASSNTRSKPAKSTSSHTSLSSQPVVVRTYSGSRHASRPSSGRNTPRLFSNMNGHTPHNPSALSTGLRSSSERLPSVDDFSFSAILRAVDPEIKDAIDAIAEICARSRMSLADEYDAHLPPQGEITGSGPGWAAGMGTLVGRGRISRIGQGWAAGENTLTVVPEASSSSERLAGESRGSISAGTSKKRSQSAYGSLKSVISSGSGGRKAADGERAAKAPKQEQATQGPAWTINASSSTANNPSITLLTGPQASPQLSLDLSSTIKELPQPSKGQLEFSPEASEPKQALHRRHTSTSSIPHSSNRPRTLSSIVSWIPWNRASQLDPTASQEFTKAEARLRDLLSISQTTQLGKGKGAVGTT